MSDPGRNMSPRFTEPLATEKWMTAVEDQPSGYRARCKPDPAIEAVRFPVLDVDAHGIPVASGCAAIPTRIALVSFFF